MSSPAMRPRAWLSGAATTATVMPGTNRDRRGRYQLIPNPVAGVTLESGTNNNIVGGTTTQGRNIISGNANGVQLDDAPSNLIQGNYIGTTGRHRGPAQYRPGRRRVREAELEQHHRRDCGRRRQRDLGNNGEGYGSRARAPRAASSRGTYIGTNAAGTAAIGNTQQGVHIFGDFRRHRRRKCSGAERDLRQRPPGDEDQRPEHEQQHGREQLIGTNAAGTAGVRPDGGIAVTSSAANDTIGERPAGT